MEINRYLLIYKQNLFLTRKTTVRIESVASSGGQGKLLLLIYILLMIC